MRDKQSEGVCYKGIRSYIEMWKLEDKPMLIV
jgi:hypothetical protein